MKHLLMPQHRGGGRGKKKPAEEAAVLWEAHSREEMNTWTNFRLHCAHCEFSLPLTCEFDQDRWEDAGKSSL